MKTIINARQVAVLGRESTQGLVIEIDLTEQQMFQALNQFLHFVSDETWAKWQEDINSNIYGTTDAKRYHFLKEFYALNSDECENEFKKLALLSGPEFDAAVDAAMAHDKQTDWSAA